MSHSIPQIPGLELLEEVGRGARNVVYRAKCRGRQVALKIPRLAESESLALDYRKEASLQARVSQANLPVVYEVGVQDRLPYMIGEFIEGTPLSRILERGPLSSELVLRLACDVAETLERVHRRGLVHRDIKPANIIIGPRGQARLIDFGLATRSHLSKQQGFTGTFRYMSPEQLGMLERPLDGRADLYSLGVVIFEALSGRPPFLEEDPTQLIRQHAVELPPRLGDFCQAPSALLEATERLLRKDPDDRFLKAGDLVAFLTRTPLVVPPQSTIVGREQELERLQSLWLEALDGRGGLVLISGQSGQGKSALAQQFASSHALVGRAKCEPETPPFGLLRNLISSTVCNLSESLQGQFQARLQQVLGGQIQLLANFSPELGQWLGLESQPQLSGVQVNQNHQVLREFFLVLAQVHPLLLLIDDAQWLDRASFQVLVRMLPSLEKNRCLLIVTSRETLLGDYRPPSRRCIELTPIPPGSMRLLVEKELGGPVDPCVVDQLLLASEGNPLAALETLEAALDEGIFVPHWGHWRCEGEGLAQLKLSGDRLQAILRRLDHLTRGQRQVLQSAALLGLHFSRDLLLKLWGEDQRTLVFSLLAEGRRLKLLESPDSHNFRFVHDSVREALLENLEPEQKSGWHRLAAHALTQPTETFARAEHFWASIPHGELDQEVCLANFEAGRLALAGQAPQEAHDYFLRAIACRPLDLELGADFEEGFGDACFLTGGLQQAREHYERALLFRQEPVQRADLWRRIGLVYALDLRSEGGWKAFHKGVQELGLSHSRSPKQRWIWLFQCLLTQKKELRLPTTSHQLAAFELYLLAVQIAIVESRPEELAEVLLRGLQLTRPLGRSPGLASFYCVYGVCLVGIGMAARGWKQLERARIMAEELDDPAARASCQAYHAMATRLAGQEQKSAELSARCLSNQSLWLDTDDFLRTSLDLTHNLHFRGHIGQAVQWAEAAARRVREESRPVIVTVTLRAVFSAVGRPSESNLGLTQSPQGSDPHAAADLISRCHALLEIGETGQEFDELIQNVRRRLGHPLKVAFHFRCVFLIEGYARYRQGRTAELGKVLRDLKLFCSHPLYATHSKLLEAGYARLRGKTRQAESLLGQAQILADRHSNAWVLLEVARMRAFLLRDQGLAQAATLQARCALAIANEVGWVLQAQRLQTEFSLSRSHSPASNPESHSQSALMVRMQKTLDGLLQLSVASARVLEPSLLYPKVLGELIHLLGAERAFLFLQQGERLCFETGIDANGAVCSEDTGHAASLVQRVAQSQRIVLLRGDEGLDSTESVVAHDIRSVLAAPMLLRERFLGVIYLDSRLARGVFGADDLQVLQALASQVAITLETARAARLEVQVRSEREQRVLAEQLGEIVGSMLVHLDQHRVLQVLLSGLNRVLSYDQGAAFLWVDGQLQQAVVEGEWQPIEAIAESGRPQIFLDGMAISAPLEAHAGKLGAITLVRNQGNAFHQGDVEWMHTFTGYASLALENARLFADVQRLATTDELTGMLNRRQFFHDAHSEWQRASRLGHPVSVIMFDVDHFKKFNDTYGHAIGDVVLRTVAARCRKCFRNIDIQGRLGGEEFAIVLVGTGLEAALVTAERLRLSIADEPFESPLGPLEVRISLGVAQPAVGETLEEVLERSDQALYRAKAGGRNRVEADRREANSLGGV